MTPSDADLTADEGDPRPASATPPGRTGAQGEGGGSMSGRGQESPEGPRGGTPPDPAATAPMSGDGATSGLATSLQPGGTLPGGGPAVSPGALGTGGASSGSADTGSMKRDGA
jgi:hypothetical protein